MSHFERVDVERRELSNVCWLSNGAQDITTDSLRAAKCQALFRRENISGRRSTSRDGRRNGGGGDNDGDGWFHSVAAFHIFADRVFNTLVFALSLFPSVSPPLSRLRLRLVIFRACSMFRSAAPTYCALFLALSHICIHTRTRTRFLSTL